VNVITVQDVTDTPLITRDMALIKVHAADGVSDVCHDFGARIIDVSSDSVIVEISDTEDQVEQLVESLRQFGIIELVRTGVVSMGRGHNILTAQSITEAI